MNDQLPLPWANNWAPFDEGKSRLEVGNHYWIKQKAESTWRVCYVSIDPDENVYVNILGMKNPIPLEQMSLEYFEIERIDRPSEALQQAIMGTVQNPKPIKNHRAFVWDLVIEDMQARDKMGKERYGVRLQPFNERNSLLDAYHEVLDLAAYLRQRIFEEDNK